MPLSWNEIKSRALTFSKEWEHETSEDAEAKSFWDDFFNIFGISRRRVATFEQQVRKVDDYILNNNMCNCFINSTSHLKNNKLF